MLLSYDFKIEFYNIDKSKKSIHGDSFPEKLLKLLSIHKMEFMLIFQYTTRIQITIL